MNSFASLDACGPPAKTLTRTDFANWPAEPFIKTGYASPGLGQILTVGKLLYEPFEPFECRLLFAGEHTEMGYFGYMEGTLRSGERAAKLLIQHASGQYQCKPKPKTEPPRVASVAPKREAETERSVEELDYGWGAEDVYRDEATADDQPKAEELARHAVYETISDEGPGVGTRLGGQALQAVATASRPPIRPTAQLRSAWRTYECAERRMVPLRLFGRWNTPVNPATVDAWRAFEQTLVGAGYQAHRAWVYNCRDIGSQKTRSLHAYGLAIDIDHKEPKCNVNRATPDNRLVRFSPAATKEDRCRDVGLGTADTSFTP